jgi:hypothetical protein
MATSLLVWYRRESSSEETGIATGTPAIGGADGAGGESDWEFEWEVHTANAETPTAVTVGRLANFHMVDTGPKSI